MVIEVAVTKHFRRFGASLKLALLGVRTRVALFSVGPTVQTVTRYTYSCQCHTHSDQQ